MIRTAERRADARRSEGFALPDRVRRAGTAGAAFGASVLVLLLLLGNLPGSTAAPGAEAMPRALAPSGHGAAAAALPTPIQHVIVIVLENAGSAQVAKGAPFEAYLASRYASAGSYYAVCHPSAPNYLALTSGAPFQCGSDAYHRYSAPNLATELAGSPLQWGLFAESMPRPCDTQDAYPYAVRHNPFVFYSDFVGNASRCTAHDLPLSAWYADVNASTIPNFAFIVPNLLDDGHDTNVATADTWLHGFLNPYLNASWFGQSAVFVTWDEGFVGGSADPSGYNGTDGGRVYLAAVSPYARAGTALPGNNSHFDLLSTVEWLLGLPSTGHNDSSAFPPMRGLFTFGIPFAVAPAANVSVGPAPLSVGFQANATGGVPPYSENWSFGDQSPNATGASVEHTYAAPGVYRAVVEGRDSAGTPGPQGFEVVATDRSSPVRVNASVVSSPGTGPLSLALRASATGGTPPYSYAWYFNADGTEVAGAQATYSLSAPGRVTAIVVATDATGAFGARAVPLAAYAPLSVSLALSAPTVAVGETETATASLSGGAPGPYRFTWTLNGTAAPNGSDRPTYAFTPRGAGNFTIGVEVNDSANGSANAIGRFVAYAAGPSHPPPCTTQCSSPHPNPPPPFGGLFGFPGLVLVGLVVLVLAVVAITLGRRRGGRPASLLEEEESVPPPPPST